VKPFGFGPGSSASNVIAHSWTDCAAAGAASSSDASRTAPIRPSAVARPVVDLERARGRRAAARAC
jgi:hypothetical protein